MTVLALQWVDLGAFVALGLAALVMVAHITGLALWLSRRERARDDADGYYSGL